jgi:hypothetical protein
VCAIFADSINPMSNKPHNSELPISQIYAIMLSFLLKTNKALLQKSAGPEADAGI